MRKKVYATILFLALCLSFVTIPAAFADTGSMNRFNVEIVLDASGSMASTDPYGYRYDAISLFTNLLAEEGNVLGGTVFSTGIDLKVEPFNVHGQGEKDQVVAALRQVPSTGGWTNIGLGLSEAIDQLQSRGNPELPSVIILLSDGNTDMASSSLVEESLTIKADAIQRARELGIRVYCVVLNANGAADVTEMEQISNGTGGVTIEVRDAAGLSDVFNAFYDLIYGTKTITLADEVFPADRVLKTVFDVPGIGVEEVNIIIQGRALEISLISPDGVDSSPQIFKYDTFSAMKLVDIQPGPWTLITKGVPGDRIKINMVYNTNLGVDVFANPADAYVNSSQPITVYATLKSGNTTASNPRQYSGYTAELSLMDAYGEEISRTPMQVGPNGFEASMQLGDGVYFFQATVTGNYLSKTSDLLGPITFMYMQSAEAAPVEVVENGAPVPVKNPYEATVYKWPFRDVSYSLDLTTLARDSDDPTLLYTIESTSFMPDDYTVVGETLTVSNFSLRKGAFTVKATDSGGLSCYIEVIIKCHNVGIMALIGLAAAALIVLAVLLILLRIALSKPFRGRIIVKSDCNGALKNGTPRSPKRGRCKLSLFGVDNIGLDYTKSYFQATGKRYIELHADKKVRWNNRDVDVVRIDSGVPVRVYMGNDTRKCLIIQFDSNIPAGARPAPKRPQPPRPPRR